MITVNGIEIAQASQQRPYFEYRLTELYFPYNGTGYYIAVNYDAADEDVVEIASEIIRSIRKR